MLVWLEFFEPRSAIVFACLLMRLNSDDFRSNLLHFQNILALLGLMILTILSFFHLHNTNRYLINNLPTGFSSNVLALLLRFDCYRYTPGKVEQQRASVRLQVYHSE